MKWMRTGLVAMASSLVLAACFHSSNDPRAVVVFGDSLADVGTFNGIKATVQKAGDAKGYPLWTQLVSDAAGNPGSEQCNAFVAGATGSSFTRNTNGACSNYAIGGGRIVTGVAQGGSASPLRVGRQMQEHAPNGYAADTIVLIDGGGNDAADLVGAYLGAASGPAGQAAYRSFLAQQLSDATLNALLSQPNGGAEQAAGAYMQALAQTFHNDIKTQVLDRGARQVVVLNMPDITLTPRFKAVLQGVAARTGSQAAAANLKGAIGLWVKAFNDRLAALAAGDSRVVIVDFFGTFTQQVANPSSFGLSNAAETACPPTGVDSTGLPTYNFLTCTDAALDATAGRTPGWWKTWLFSDGFHPTPFGQQLLGEAVVKAMRQQGWI